MSDYSSRINALSIEIQDLNDSIAAARARRAELAEARRKLVSERDNLDSDEELIKSPETGESGSTGSHATNHEDAERDMVLKGHQDLPDQVQEKIDAIDSERDSLLQTISDSRSTINSKKDTMSSLKEKQKAERAKQGG
ncbi:DUF5082 family protein [Bacillus sp. FSL W7-1360]